MSLSLKSNQKKNELSFTQKCILTSNVLYDTDKDLLNSLFFIPLVKLYTATMRQETFSYTGIKGGLFILRDADKEVKNLHIRIYDSEDYSIKFNLEISPETKKNYVKIEPNFYCFNLRIGCIGFLFASEKEAVEFKTLLINDGEPHSIDAYKHIKLFNLKDTDNMYLDVIEKLMVNLEKIYNYITYDKLYKQNNPIVEYLIFSGFNDMSKLLNNTEFDYEDYIFNIFVDKKFPLKLFNNIFQNYYKDYLYPIRPIYNDLLSIDNKSNYIDLLVNHLVNNFKEQVYIYKKRKEHNLREKKSKSVKTITNVGDNTIIEEELNDDSVERSSTYFGRFFSGLNPFK
jgi:hypothetical protein